MIVNDEDASAAESRAVEACVIGAAAPALRAYPPCLRALLLRGCTPRCLVVFLTETGCRCGEVAGLKVSDVDVATGLATVIGKGNKQRFVFFSEATQQTLQQWLVVRDIEGPSLFGLTEWGIRQALRRLGDRVGVRANPHKFRRTSATLTAKNGANAFFLQQKMGWASINMAEYYVNLAQLEQRSRASSPMDRLLRLDK